MNLVKEHINEVNFTRGLDPKRAMNIGISFYTTNMGTADNHFRNREGKTLNDIEVDPEKAGL